MHFTTAIIALALVACTGAHHAASVDGAIANPDAPASCDPSTGCIVTSLGPVQGTVLGTVLEVKGVPYAAPPVGNLRWRPPQPATPWTDILEATSFGSECMQLDLHDGTAAGGSEDCLTLNVWAPLQTTTPLPVMVFIHGGYYVQGGADIAWHGQYAYDGKSLASAGAIVVTVQYRLGALGFLDDPTLAAAGDPHANYGTLDQIAALQWVQTNAAAFGGDPNRGMIFGQSAGGVSVCQ